MVYKKSDESFEAEIINEKRHLNHYHREGGRIFLGLLFIVIGGLFFIQSYFGIDIWKDFWPIVIIFIGILLIVGRKR